MQVQLCDKQLKKLINWWSHKYEKLNIFVLSIKIQKEKQTLIYFSGVVMK